MLAGAVALALCVSAHPASAAPKPARGLAKPGKSTSATHRPKRSVARSDKSTGAAHTVRRTIQSGGTLTGVLREFGLSPRQINEWDESMRVAAGNFRLSPGHVLNLRFNGRTLTSLSYEVDDCMRVIVERHAGELRGRWEPLQARVKLAAAEGIVVKSFFQAARQANIPDKIVSQMADILGWEYDFRRVQPNDRFRVLYERRISADGRALPPGKILAAEIRGTQRVAQAFYFDDNGQGVYVDGKGRTLSNGFLRYPVEFSRITSHYSKARFHPILHVSRPHNGVDFAASTGTPVRAAGDGMIASAGRNGDYGNHIEIRHENGWSTTYSHLNSIASVVHPGQPVKQGQIIGTVGQTGLATGPHLHFALYRNGQYSNPLTAKVELRRDVRDPKRFASAKQALLRQIASLVRPAVRVDPIPVMVAALPLSQRPAPVTLTF